MDLNHLQNLVQLLESAKNDKDTEKTNSLRREIRTIITPETFGEIFNEVINTEAAEICLTALEVEELMKFFFNVLKYVDNSSNLDVQHLLATCPPLYFPLVANINSPMVSENVIPLLRTIIHGEVHSLLEARSDQELLASSFLNTLAPMTNLRKYMAILEHNVNDIAEREDDVSIDKQIEEENDENEKMEEDDNEQVKEDEDKRDNEQNRRDIKLVEAVEKYGVGKWKEIKAAVFANDTSVTRKNLRDHWRSLIGKAEKGKWKEGEQLLQRVIKLKEAKKPASESLPCSIMCDEILWKSKNKRSNYVVIVDFVELQEDYPAQAFYNSNVVGIDEKTLYAEVDKHSSDDLPTRMLRNWTIYKMDMAIVSLELLPMKPCENNDNSIFASGDIFDGDGWSFDDAVNRGDWTPIYSTPIHEWKVEISSSKLFFYIRTDLAWYKLCKPSTVYQPWFAPVFKAARLGLILIDMAKEETEKKVKKLTLKDIIDRLMVYKKEDKDYISSERAHVERFVAVHSPILVQMLCQIPSTITLATEMMLDLTKTLKKRCHTKLPITKSKALPKSPPNSNPNLVLKGVFKEAQNP